MTVVKYKIKYRNLRGGDDEGENPPDAANAVNAPDGEDAPDAVNDADAAHAPKQEEEGQGASGADEGTGEGASGEGEGASGEGADDTGNNEDPEGDEEEEEEAPAGTVDEVQEATNKVVVEEENIEESGEDGVNPPVVLEVSDAPEEEEASRQEATNEVVVEVSGTPAPTSGVAAFLTGLISGISGPSSPEVNETPEQMIAAMQERLNGIQKELNDLKMAGTPGPIVTGNEIGTITMDDVGEEEATGEEEEATREEKPTEATGGKRSRSRSRRYW